MIVSAFPAAGMCYVSPPECQEALGAKKHAEIACHSRILEVMIRYIETSDIVLVALGLSFRECFQNSTGGFWEFLFQKIAGVEGKTLPQTCFRRFLFPF